MRRMLEKWGPLEMCFADLHFQYSAASVVKIISYMIPTTGCIFGSGIQFCKNLHNLICYNYTTQPSSQTVPGYSANVYEPELCDEKISG